MIKSECEDLGIALLTQFCTVNSISQPTIRSQSKSEFLFSDRTCAYYRPSRISICPTMCAAPGSTGASWSWPGYVIDRTPYGVLQHELGHHVDYWSKSTPRGAYWSNYSRDLRASSKEDKLTNYCPNDAEWFAEMFRLFVTNPDLLSAIRPRTHELISKRYRPAHSLQWDTVLLDAPQRTIDQCEKRIRAARQGKIL